MNVPFGRNDFRLMRVVSIDDSITRWLASHHFDNGVGVYKRKVRIAQKIV